MIRNRVRELRGDRGWSQAELARRVNISDRSISRIEAGKTRLNSDMLERMSKAFGVPPEDVLGGGLDPQLLQDVIECVYELARDRRDGYPPSAFAKVALLAYENARIIEQRDVRKQALPAIVRALVSQQNGAMPSDRPVS